MDPKILADQLMLSQLVKYYAHHMLAPWTFRPSYGPLLGYYLTESRPNSETDARKHGFDLFFVHKRLSWSTLSLVVLSLHRNYGKNKIFGETELFCKMTSFFKFFQSR